MGQKGKRGKNSENLIAGARVWKRQGAETWETSKQCPRKPQPFYCKPCHWEFKLILNLGFSWPAPHENWYYLSISLLHNPKYCRNNLVVEEKLLKLKKGVEDATVFCLGP